MGKALLYEESAKAPMIMYDPRLSNEKHTKRVKALISIVDIVPTLLDIAGIEIPDIYPGKSFMPLVYSEKEMIHEAVYGENNFDNFYPLPSEVENVEDYESIRSKFVRTPEYKYIRYHETQPVIEELYKINEDPLETNNLIGDKNYFEVTEMLREKMQEFEDSVVN